MGKTKHLSQSTLEYILILTAVIAVIIFAAAKFMRPATDKYLQDSNTAMDRAADQLPNGE